MVKGTCRQVIVVRPPDKALFEQAVFFLREDRPELSRQELIAQANREVSGYLHTHVPGSRGAGVRWWPFLLSAAFGAGIVALLWFLTAIM